MPRGPPPTGNRLLIPDSLASFAEAVGVNMQLSHAKDAVTLPDASVGAAQRYPRPTA